MIDKKIPEGNPLEREAQTSQQPVPTLNYATTDTNNKSPYIKPLIIGAAIAVLLGAIYGGCRLYQALEPLKNLSVDFPAGL
ncbi:MAG: hypothetical protein ABIB47_04985 [Candidatus Woesearchaeota archaeon]